MIACLKDTLIFRRFSSLDDDTVAYKQMFLYWYPILLNYLRLHNIPAGCSEEILFNAFKELWLQRKKKEARMLNCGCSER